MEKYKDPAFLFYPESFLVGVMDMTDEEVGQYIKLMCRQHQKGHLPTAVIEKASDAVREKFVQDADGRWYNERLELEIQKRAKWTASRRKNLEGKKHDSEPKPATGSQKSCRQNCKMRSKNGRRCVQSRKSQCRRRHLSSGITINCLNLRSQWTSRKKSLSRALTDAGQVFTH